MSVNIIKYFIFIFFAVTSCDLISISAFASGSATHPYRLTISGKNIFDENSVPIRLRGVNIDSTITGAADANTIANSYHMNLVRLRILYSSQNRDTTPSGFTAAYTAQVDSVIQAFAAQKVWMVLEMVPENAVQDSPDLYNTALTGPCAAPKSCANYGYYLHAWQYLVNQYKNTDYIAGYGLEAEPAAVKTGADDSDLTLVTFQKALMDSLSTVDPVTPFFIGPDYTYGSLALTNIYYTYFMPTYQNRLVYEIDFLTPNEWIKNGSWTLDGSKPTYPFPNPPPGGYDVLLQGEGPNHPPSRVYEQQRLLPGNYQLTLSPGFSAWYLQTPVNFSNQYNVPIYVNQFGASTNANGELAYENDLIQFCEANGIHWSRWTYNSGNGDPSRDMLATIAGNIPVIQFYENLMNHLLNSITVITQPVSQSVGPDSPVTLSVQAQGGALTYQWNFNGQPIAGATSAQYSFISKPARYGNYTVLIKNAWNSIVSDAAVVSLILPPKITTQPQGQLVTSGTVVNLNVFATGSNLSFQWLFNGAAISGAISAQYSFIANAVNTGVYSVVISNKIGTVTSGGATIALLVVPTITFLTRDQMVALGSRVTLAVGAGGTKPFTYQWLFNGKAIPGATQWQYVFTAALGNGGGYSVIVKNSAGSVTSGTSNVSIGVAPKIIKQPQSQTVIKGQQVTLRADASGPLLKYQWYLNGTAIIHGIGSQYSFTALQANIGTYQVIIKNDWGSVSSQNAVVSF